MDASHVFWQQADPVAVVRDLGPLIVHAAAKDVRINTANARLYGVHCRVVCGGSRGIPREGVGDWHRRCGVNAPLILPQTFRGRKGQW